MKPPPKSVTNEAAWSYTLHKLASYGKLTEEGDPQNYGAAMAIYKNVVKKYAAGDIPLPVVESETLYSASREEIVGFQVPRWVIARNTAFGSTDESTNRMWFDAGGRERTDANGQNLLLVRYRWCVESHGEDRKVLAAIPVETALWLAREQPEVIAWIREQTEEAIATLDGTVVDGLEIGGRFYSNASTLTALRRAREELERGLNVAA